MTNTQQPEFTPGPWKAQYDDYGDEVWYGGEGAGMWKIEGPDLCCLSGTEKANAALIAAAPDLYAALEFCLQFLQANDDGEEDVVDRIKSAKSALSKARGAKS